MTETTDNKPKKLTLGNSKLSLTKPIDSLGTTRSFVGSRSNTIVEVKKSKTLGNSLSLGKISSLSNSDSETNSEEFQKRLNILKKAAQDAKSKEHDPRFSSLSKLAAMNQIKAEEIEDSEQHHEEIVETNDSKLVSIATESNQSTKVEQNILFTPAVLDYEEEESANKKKISESKVVSTKPKIEEQKKLRKTDILHMLESDTNDIPAKTRSLASIKRAREKEKRKADFQKQEKVYREVIIPEVISVGELSNRMAERGTDVIKELMKLGIIASSSQSIDADTAQIIVETFGHTAKRVQESDVENVLIDDKDTAENLLPRAPIVTVMGHVDHGKTSLLDALKSTDVVSTEAGGITQHIGAYRVNLKDGKAITFIDTPGHEAFTEMRTRGAQVTDIVVLVVAADDGIKKQTVEAINHAKAAKVPIIVAINKIDKADINIDRVKNELLNHELVSEDLGGDIIIVPVSALKRTNLDKLEEAILLVAEMQELRANPNANASGTVIEAKIDKNKGVIATVLVRRGTLKYGDLIVAGSSYGRVKLMKNDKGVTINKAGPSEPLEIFGLNEAPRAGDKFDVVQNDKQARDISEYRDNLFKEKKVSIIKRASLEDLFSKASGKNNHKELPIIIKGDVQGSVEAIVHSLSKFPNDEVSLRILHSGVGGITESDISLAKASSAIVLGFNVRTNPAASLAVEKDNVDVRYYSIIYNLLDDIKAVIGGMLSPIIREQYIGSVEIREIFNITKVGRIAGSYVTKGTIKRGAGVRLLRDDVVIHEGKLKTLKRFKDEVKEVREGYECGIAFENYEDIKIGDTVEVFEIIEERKQFG